MVIFLSRLSMNHFCNFIIFFRCCAEVTLSWYLSFQVLIFCRASFNLEFLKDAISMFTLFNIGITLWEIVFPLLQLWVAFIYLARRIWIWWANWSILPFSPTTIFVSWLNNWKCLRRSSNLDLKELMAVWTFPKEICSCNFVSLTSDDKRFCICSTNPL